MVVDPVLVTVGPRGWGTDEAVAGVLARIDYTHPASPPEAVAARPDLKALGERIRAEKVTGFPLVPTMAAMILQMRDLEPGFLPSLRYLSNTAAALPSSEVSSGLWRRKSR